MDFNAFTKIKKENLIVAINKKPHALCYSWKNDNQSYPVSGMYVRGAFSYFLAFHLSL